jgi:hypothetical protein
LKQESEASGNFDFGHFLPPTVAFDAEAAAQPWREAALARWDELCGRVGKTWTWRALLEHLTGEDVLERVRSILQRHLAAHLDLGVAAWRNPARECGFFAAWRASAGFDMAWEMDELPNVRDEVLHLPDSPLDVLLEELPRLLPDDSLWGGYLERLSLELPGWSGMFLWRERNPGRGDGTPVAMLDYLAVRVLLERLLIDDLLRRLSGAPMTLAELQAHFAARPEEFLVRDALAPARPARGPAGTRRMPGRAGPQRPCRCRRLAASGRSVGAGAGRDAARRCRLAVERAVPPAWIER